MYSKIAFLLFFSLVILFEATAQVTTNSTKGSIYGTIVDAQTGETLVGVNVVIEGTMTGRSTDIDGKYVINGIEPGVYTLVASYVSYSKQRITNIEVKAGEQVKVDITLSPAFKTLQEVTVSAEANRATEASLLRLQFKAPAIMDGISIEQIKRTPDSNSSDALRRITGVTITGGKFINVRGTPERYSGAMLNGSQAPSTEPDKRSFSFDLVPSNLIDNIVIIKAATPDLPGDFTGGMVKINTVDFPTSLTLNLTYGIGYKSHSTFGDFKVYTGGKTDLLGLDDGSRKLPAGFPNDLLPSKLTREQINAFAKQLPNNWAPTTTTAPADQNLSVALGNTFGKNDQFGIIAALSYRTGFSNAGLIRNEFEVAGDPRFEYSGNRYLNTVLWGGILNLSWKPNLNHKFSFKNTITTSGDDEVTELEGPNYTDLYADLRQTILRFTSRQILTIGLSGEHYFQHALKDGLDLRWNVYQSRSNRDEPDYRRAIYQRNLDDLNGDYYASLGQQANVRNGGRFYSSMEENINGVSSDVSYKINQIKISTGANYDYKTRDFSARLLGMIVNAPGNGFTDFKIPFLPLDQVFDPSNFRRNGLSIEEFRDGSNTYDARQSTAAGFVMIDAPIEIGSKSLRIIGGLRYEMSQQRVNTLNSNFTKKLNIQNDANNVLPSLNLTYNLTEKSNIRLSGSKTLNRPELRELAPFSYFDYNTQTSLRGNEALKQAEILNYDIRYEIYPDTGELLAASIFYKDLSNAIEQVIVAGAALNAERTFANADKATNYGFEVEARKRLGFLSDQLANTLVSLNYTRVESTVDVKSTGVTLERKDKPLQGQSAYALNVGLSTTLPVLETTIGLYYNRLGSRIVEVATNFDDDVIEAPRDLIDLTISQPLFSDRYEMKFSAKNLLGQHQRFYQAGKLVRQNNEFSSFSVGFSLKF